MSIHISVPLLLVFATPNAVINSEKALRELDGKVDAHSRSAVYSLYLTNKERTLKSNEYALAPGSTGRLADILDEVRNCPVAAHHNFIQVLYIADSDTVNMPMLADFQKTMQAYCEAMQVNLIARCAWILHGNMLRAANRQADQLADFKENAVWRSLTNLILISDVYENGARVEYNLYKVAVLAALRLSDRPVSNWLITLSFAKIGKPQEEIDRLLRYCAADRLKNYAFSNEQNGEALFAQELAPFFACGLPRRGAQSDNLAAMTRSWVKKLLPRPIDALAMPRGEKETNIERLEALAQTFVEDNIVAGQSAIVNAARQQIEQIEADVIAWIHKRARIGEAVAFFAPGGLFDRLIEAAEETRFSTGERTAEAHARKGLLEKEIDFQNRIILLAARGFIDRESGRITGEVLSQYRAMGKRFYKTACLCRDRMLAALKIYDMEAAEYAGLQQELSAYYEAIVESFDEGRVRADWEGDERDLYPEEEGCAALWQGRVEEIAARVQAENAVFSADFWASLQNAESVMRKMDECAQRARPLLSNYYGIKETLGETRFIPARFKDNYAAVTHGVVWVDCDSVEVMSVLALSGNGGAEASMETVWTALEGCSAFARNSFVFEDEPMMQDVVESHEGVPEKPEQTDKAPETAESGLSLSVKTEGKRVFLSWIWQGGPRADARVICRDGHGNVREDACTSGQFAVAGSRMDITGLIGYGRNEITVRHLNVPGEMTGEYVKARRVYYEMARYGASKVFDGDEKTAMDVYQLALWSENDAAIGRGITDKLCLSRAAGSAEGDLRYRLNFDDSQEKRRRGSDNALCLFQGMSLPRDKAISLSTFPGFETEIELHKG